MNENIETTDCPIDSVLRNVENDNSPIKEIGEKPSNEFPERSEENNHDNLNRKLQAYLNTKESIPREEDDVFESDTELREINASLSDISTEDDDDDSDTENIDPLAEYNRLYEKQRQLLQQQIDMNEKRRFSVFGIRRRIRKKEDLGSNRLVKFATEHEVILQVILFLPLTLMALYIVFVEEGDLWTVISNTKDVGVGNRNGMDGALRTDHM